MKSRLEKVRDMLKASTDRQGKPLSGYAERVAAINAEIKRLDPQGQ